MYDKNLDENTLSNYRQHSLETLISPRVYIVPQPFIGMFPLNIALKKGTVFPNINVNYPLH